MVQREICSLQWVRSKTNSLESQENSRNIPTCTTKEADTKSNIYILCTILLKRDTRQSLTQITNTSNVRENEQAQSLKDERQTNQNYGRSSTKYWKNCTRWMHLSFIGRYSRLGKRSIGNILGRTLLGRTKVAWTCITTTIFTIVTVWTRLSYCLAFILWAGRVNGSTSYLVGGWALKYII